MALDEKYFQGTFPYDAAAQARTHYQPWLHPCLTDPLQRLNQSAIIDTDLYTGVEGWDYQNPYVWQSRGLLTVATLDASYGIAADSDVSVVANIRRSGGAVVG